MKYYVVDTNGDLRVIDVDLGGNIVFSELYSPPALNSSISVNSTTTVAELSVSKTQNIDSTIATSGNIQADLGVDVGISSDVSVSSSTGSVSLSSETTIQSTIDGTSSVSGGVGFIVELDVVNVPSSVATFTIPPYAGLTQFYSVDASPDGQHIIAGKLSSSNQIYVSHDGGNTWALPPTPPISGVNAINHAKIYNADVYAFVNESSDRITWTTDGGNTWNLSGFFDRLSGTGTRIISPTRIRVVGGNGKIWNLDLTNGISVQLTNPPAHRVTINPVVDTDIIYMMNLNTGTIYKYTDTTGYTVIGSRPTTATLRRFYSNKENVIHYVTDTDIYTSHDEGATWSQYTATKSFVSKPESYLGSYISSNGDYVVAAAGGLSSIQLEYQISKDGGLTWETEPSMAGEFYITGTAAAGMDKFFVSSSVNEEPAIVGKTLSTEPNINAVSEFQAGTVESIIPVEGTIDVVSSSTQSVGINYGVDTVINSTSDSSSDIEVVTGTGSDITATTTVTGDMIPLTLVDSIIDGTSTFTSPAPSLEVVVGSVINANGSIDSSLSGTLSLSANTMSAESVFQTTDLDILRELDATQTHPNFRLGGTSDVVASTYSTILLDGTIDAVSELQTPNLLSSDRLESFIDGVSSTDVSLTINSPVDSTIDVVSDGNADMGINRGVDSNITTIGAVDTGLSTDKQLDTTIQATSSVTGYITFLFDTNMTATSTVTGSIGIASDFSATTIDGISDFQESGLVVDKGFASDTSASTQMDGLISQQVQLSSFIDIVGTGSLSSNLDINVVMSTDITAAANMYQPLPSLTTDYNMFSDINVELSVDSTLTNTMDISTNINGVSDFIDVPLLGDSSLNSTITAVSDMEPMLLDTINNFGSIMSGVSTFNPQITVYPDFGSVTIQGTSNVQDTDLIRTKYMESTITGIGWGDSSLTTNIDVESGICMSSDISVTGNIGMARLGFEKEIGATGDVTATLSAKLGKVVPVDSTVAANSTITSELTNVVYIDSTIAATTSTNTSIIRNRSIESDIDSKSGIIASPSYNQEICLSATFGSESVIDGSITRTMSVGTTITGMVDADITIKGTTGLSAGIPVTSNMIADVSDYTFLSTTILTGSVVDGNITRIKYINSNIDGDTEVSGDIDVFAGVCLSSDLVTESDVVAELTRIYDITTQINTISTVSAELGVIDVHVDGSISATGAVSGDIFVTRYVDLASTIIVDSTASLLSDPVNHQLDSTISATSDITVANVLLNIVDGDGNIIFKPSNDRVFWIEEDTNRVIYVEGER